MRHPRQEVFHVRSTLFSSWHRYLVQGTTTLLSTLCVLWLAGCSSTPPKKPAPTPAPVVPGVLFNSQSSSLLTQWRDAVNNTTVGDEAWQQLPGWSPEHAMSAWGAFRDSCQALMRSPGWRDVCQDAQHINGQNPRTVQQFFESHFKPVRMLNDDGSSTGLITGYYEPIMRGSTTRHGPYQTPLYRYPIGTSIAKVNKPRAQLLKQGTLKGHEMLWVEDPVEAAFLHIQGSGRVILDTGKTIRVGFAGTNNQPFRSFARWLLDRHEISADQATMPGIRQWAKQHPNQIETMLNVNPRMVFFRELPLGEMPSTTGPVGALGVPLTPEHSIAVDPARVPLGAPVFLSTTRPLSNEPIQKLVIAQDTGSAIKGPVRADFFWGHGDQAGETAGRMKQPGQMWMLIPKQLSGSPPRK